MFSFRPDAEAQVTDFVPTPVASPLSQGLELGPLVPEEVEAPPEVEEEPEPLPPTPEEIAALEQAAFDRGVATAQAEQSSLDAICAAMDSALAEWQTTTSTLLTKNRRHVLALTETLVRHWVGVELETSAETYAAYLDRALEGLDEATSIRLVVSASDLARLESHAGDALTHWQNAGVEIAAEADAAPGSFRIETPSAEILGDLDRISARLAEVLAPAIATAAPEATDASETEEDTADSAVVEDEKASTEDADAEVAE